MFRKKKPQTKLDRLVNLVSKGRRRKRLGKIGTAIAAFQALKIISDSKVGNKNAR